MQGTPARAGLRGLRGALATAGWAAIMTACSSNAAVSTRIDAAPATPDAAPASPDAATDADPPTLVIPFAFALQGHGIADFMGDGSTVLIVGGPDLDQRNVEISLQALRIGRDGSLANVTTTLLPDAPTAVLCRHGLVGDLNGDGRPDFFCASHGWDHEPWPGEAQVLLLSRPDGTLRTAPVPPIRSFAHSGALGDLRRTGRLDVYVGEYNMTPNPDLPDDLKGPNTADGKVGPFILRNEGGGVFAYDNRSLPPGLSQLWLAEPGTPGRHTASLLVDVDGDGYPELITGSDQDKLTAGAVFRNDGAGSFANAVPRLLPVGLFGIANTITLDIEAADLNGDGASDLLLLQTGSGYVGRRIQLLMNDGSGNFADETATRMPPQPGGVYAGFFLHLADYDADGNTDIFVQVGFNWPLTPGPQQDDVLLYVSDGAGRFVAAPDSLLPPRALWNHLVPLDFDGDGVIDVLDFEAENWHLPGTPGTHTRVFVRGYRGVLR
jgi:hypothetical protein